MSEQTIIRVQKDKDNPYVMVNKDCLNDPGLSLAEKGLLTYLLSMPNDWQIYVKELTKHHSNCINSICGILNKLIKNRYCIRKRLHDKKGRFQGFKYTVFERKYKVPKTDSKLPF